MNETELVTITRVDWQNLYALTGCLMGVMFGVMAGCVIMSFIKDKK